jgi:hypothetical protein
MGFIAADLRGILGFRRCLVIICGHWCDNCVNPLPDFLLCAGHTSWRPRFASCFSGRYGTVSARIGAHCIDWPMPTKTDC